MSARRTARGVVLVLATAVWLAVPGCGRHEGPGEPSGAPVPPEAVARRDQASTAAAATLAPGAPPASQILFGDLHVHTTFSLDAFQRSLPLMGGDGAHPPADACDFARFCSALDFWAITDHAESLTPRHWRETKESIRHCEALGGGPRPALVSFLGWEWTQESQGVETHYGHRNVILRDLADARVPARPIAPRPALKVSAPVLTRRRLLVPWRDPLHAARYRDWFRFLDALRVLHTCPADVSPERLPLDCQEVARTPAELFARLRAWPSPALVIPHGTTRGTSTPPGWTWASQLGGGNHDPVRERLFEVFSGHGNAEEYRPWNAALLADGTPHCPAPDATYEPCCWRAGELIRARCGDAAPDECERRVEQARRLHVQAGKRGRLTVRGARVEEWRDCGQCRDCFIPAYEYRPGGSAQLALALGDFKAGAPPGRFRFGFVGSSDTHQARPGTGYKEVARRAMTDATGIRDAGAQQRVFGPDPERLPWAVPLAEGLKGITGFRRRDFERSASFFLTGGLVAVHADGRDRDAIWTALERRTTYATSGPRILLWFDVLNGPDGVAPMGSEIRMRAAPRFRVRAAGAFRQRPGCPPWVAGAIGASRVRSLCAGECYHPSDERYRLTRVEVVRIRPQVRVDESAGGLIDDPWLTLPCDDRGDGCVVEFTDPEFPTRGRETVYYVRAVQEPTPAVNAGGLRCTFDAQGGCAAVRPCYADFRTPDDDDCLAPNEERAWSSPIFVSFAGG